MYLQGIKFTTEFLIRFACQLQPVSEEMFNSLLRKIVLLLSGIDAQIISPAEKSLMQFCCQMADILSSIVTWGL